MSDGFHSLRGHQRPVHVHVRIYCRIVVPMCYGSTSTVSYDTVALALALPYAQYSSSATVRTDERQSYIPGTVL